MTTLKAPQADQNLDNEYFGIKDEEQKVGGGMSETLKQSNIPSNLTYRGACPSEKASSVKPRGDIFQHGRRSSEEGADLDLAQGRPSHEQPAVCEHRTIFQERVALSGWEEGLFRVHGPWLCAEAEDTFVF